MNGEETHPLGATSADDLDVRTGSSTLPVSEWGPAKNRLPDRTEPDDQHDDN